MVLLEMRMMVANKQERENLVRAIQQIDLFRMTTFEDTSELAQAKLLIREVLEGRFVQSYRRTR
jgi:hypothetical protein